MTVVKNLMQKGKELTPNRGKNEILDFRSTGQAALDLLVENVELSPLLFRIKHVATT